MNVQPMVAAATAVAAPCGGRIYLVLFFFDFLTFW